jgi:peptide/nickel transport system substrate-binding protein
MSTTRKAQRAAAAALLLLAAAACGSEGGRSAAVGAGEPGGTPVSGGTAVLPELSDLGKPLPLVLETALDGNLSDIMYMTLLRGAWDGRLLYLTAEQNPMAIARSYEYLPPDSTALRYHMRSDLKWSDGEPITARDVVFTYTALRDPALAAPRQDYTEHIDSVTAQNDSTVTVHFKRRYPEMLFHSGLGIVPAHVYRDADLATLRSHPSLTDPSKLVVSGAFKIGRWQPGQQITLVHNPEFRPEARLERIVIRVIPEVTTRLVELRTGGVDYLGGVPFDQIPALKVSNPELRFERERNRNYEYIGYNPKAFEAFADPEIRRALGMAIDVPGIVQALQMEDFATPAGGPYPPIFQTLYDPEKMAPLPHDPERAKQILESKGWVDTNGDGVRDKNGRPLRFSLLTNAGNARRADVSLIVQNQWKQIGVDVQLQSLESNTFFDRLQKKEFTAALAGWSVGLSPDLSNVWGPKSAFNFVSYDNPEVTRLMEQALDAKTDAEANPLWEAAAARMVQDQPYNWLYYYDTVDAVNNRLRGMKIDTYGPYQNAWEWWIPRELQRGAAAEQTAAPAESTTTTH